MKLLFVNNGLDFGHIYAVFLDEQHTVINVTGVKDGLHEAVNHKPEVIIISSECAHLFIEQLESDSRVIVIAPNAVPSAQSMTAYKVLHHENGRPPEPEVFIGVISEIEESLIA